MSHFLVLQLLDILVIIFDGMEGRYRVTIVALVHGHHQICTVIRVHHLREDFLQLRKRWPIFRLQRPATQHHRISEFGRIALKSSKVLVKTVEYFHKNTLFYKKLHFGSQSLSVIGNFRFQC